MLENTDIKKSLVQQVFNTFFMPVVFIINHLNGLKNHEKDQVWEWDRIKRIEQYKQESWK